MHCFLCLSNIPLYICITASLSIHLQLDIQLLPCFSYCKQCYSEHWGTCFFLDFGFLWVYAWEWDYWVIWWFYFQCYKKTPYFLPQWLHQFTFPPTLKECSLFSTLSPAFIACRHFVHGHCDQCEVISHCSFDLHFSNNERC